MSTQDQDGGMPQSDEILSGSPQLTPQNEVSPIVVIPPVATPVATPAQAETPADLQPPAQPEAERPAEPAVTESTDDGASNIVPEDEAGPGDEFYFPPPEPTNNALQEKKVYAEAKDWNDANITLPLPPDTAARTNNYLERQPNINLAETKEGAEWFENLEAGLSHGSFADNRLPVAKREGAMFKQRLMHGDKRLEAAVPRIGDDGPLLTGQRAVLRVNAMLGHGSILSIPLWHTGIWITLKVPKETALLDMHQRWIEEKIRLGRVTNGLAFANYSVFTAEALVNLAMEHVYETSVKDITSAAELRAMIKTPDLDIIAWGLACVIWPRGFQYTRSLLDENGQKTETIQEKLNVGSLLWVDENSIDEWQRSHMSNRSTGSMSKESIKLYQERFTRGQQKTVALTDDVHVRLRVPTLEQYLKAGQQWVNETVAAVNASFTEETSNTQRNKIILDRGKATSLRQYVHWIDSFEFPTIEKRMVDEETIAEECSMLSSDDTIRAKYYDVMREYINESTVAIIATPLAHDKEKPQEHPKFPWLLPLDPISTFFTLLSQKATQIQLRP